MRCEPIQRSIGLRVAVVCASCAAGAAFVACTDRETAPSASSDEPIALTAVEEWTIDGHAAELVSMAWIAVSPADQAYVSQYILQNVLSVTPDGDVLGAFGRQGEGPGEFELVGVGGMLGDTLWIYDGRLRRLTFVAPGLEFMRTESWPTGTVAFEGDEFFRASLQGVTPQRLIHATLEKMPGTPESAFLRQGLVDLEGNVRRLIVDQPRGPSFAPMQSEFGVLGVLFPFPIVPLYAVSDNGRYSALLTVAIDGEHEGTFEVVSYDEHGDVRYSRRLAFDPVAIPPAAADSALDALAERLRPMAPDIVDNVRRQSWIPPFMPPVERVFAGRDGSVWVELAANDSVSHYRVIDPAGERVGAVAFPAAVRVRAGDQHQVWGTVRDEVGVGSLVKYRVRWDPAP